MKSKNIKINKNFTTLAIHRCNGADSEIIIIITNPYPGANTELKDADGRTALHVAAWQGYTDIVQVEMMRRMAMMRMAMRE